MKIKKEVVEEKPQAKKSLTKKGDPRYAGTICGAMSLVGFVPNSINKPGGAINRS